MTVRHRQVDPTTLAVVNGTLESAVREMRAVLVRSGRSPIIAIATDFSNAIFNAHGEQVVQGDDQPVHLGSMAVAMQEVRQYFGDNWSEGDMAYVNDPLFGGGHLADMALFKPVYWNGDIVAWVGNRIHASDAGGSVAGGFNPRARELYEEGLRIPPVKIAEGGVLREDLVNLIMANVRTGRAHRGDLGAQIGAVGAAERRIVELERRLGPGVVAVAMSELLARGERLARETFRGLLRGETSGIAHLENPDGGPTLAVKCRLTPSESGHVRVSLEAPPQLQRYANSYFGNTISAVYAGMLSVLPKDMPHNGGVYRAIEIDAGPPGTIVNAVEPAPCSMATGQVFDVISEAVEDALSQVVPGRAVAGWAHFCGLAFSGTDSRTNEPFAFVSTMAAIGGAGAMWETDGWSCCSPQCAGGGCRSGNVEEIEFRVPLQVNEFEFAPDTEGPGEWRGGFGVRFEVEVLEDACVVAQIGDGFEIAPPGRLGATAHTCVFTRALVRDDTAEPVPPHSVFTLRRGEKLRSISPGGGGIGDPARRDRESLRRDILGGLISAGRAAEAYGYIHEGAGAEK